MDTCPFVGPLIPLFWTVSKLEWAALFALGGGVCDACYLRFTFGAIPADLLATSMAAELFPSTCAISASWNSLNMASSLMLTLGPAYNEHWAINGQFSEETRVIAINIKNVQLYTSTAYKKSNRILFLIGNQFFVAA